MYYRNHSMHIIFLFVLYCNLCVNVITNIFLLPFFHAIKNKKGFSLVFFPYNRKKSNSKIKSIQTKQIIIYSSYIVEHLS